MSQAASVGSIRIVTTPERRDFLQSLVLLTCALGRPSGGALGHECGWRLLDDVAEAHANLPHLEVNVVRAFGGR